MNPRSKWTLAAGALLALAAGMLTMAAVSAQERPADAAPPAAAAEDGYDAQVKALGDPDFATREKAYAALKDAGDAARKAIEKGAKSPDTQVRWASKRLLRLLKEEGKEARRGLVFDDGDEAGRVLRAVPYVGGGWQDPDFDRAMEDLRRRMAELESKFGGQSPRGGIVPIPGGGARVERHAVSEKDGERVEVRVDAGGKVKVTLSRMPEDGSEAKEEAFEAESLEALEKEHPEIHAKVKDLLGNVPIRTWTDVGRLPGIALPRLRFGYPPTEGGSVKKALLGVTVSPVPDLLRAHLPVIPEGVGLVVEEVLKKTPAEEMGLRPNDILLSVNGIPVSTADEVRSAVEAVKKGGEIRIRILRAGKAEEVSGKR